MIANSTTLYLWLLLAAAPAFSMKTMTDRLGNSYSYYPNPGKMEYVTVVGASAEDQLSKDSQLRLQEESFKSMSFADM